MIRLVVLAVAPLLLLIDVKAVQQKSFTSYQQIFPLSDIRDHTKLDILQSNVFGTPN
jgi:hypothetical protein